MSNSGLKEYTKQITGSIGIVDYAVNLCKIDANLIYKINLIKTNGKNPIKLELIYNYQNRMKENKFGLGIKTNYDYEVEPIKLTSNIKVKNPDGSEDIYSYDSIQLSQEIGRYHSKTTTHVLEAYHEVKEYKMKLIDKYGNYIGYKEKEYERPAVIENKNKLKQEIYFKENILIDNLKGTKIKYIEEENKIKNIIVIENNKEIYEIELNYDENNLSGIIINNQEDEIENIIIENKAEEIEIIDFKRNEGILFLINNKYVNKVYKKNYHNNGYTQQLITKIEYEETKTKITNRYNETKEIYYLNNKCLYEKDNYNNYQDYKYNEYGKIEYIGNIYNIEQAIDNKIEVTTETGLNEITGEEINNIGIKSYSVTLVEPIKYNVRKKFSKGKTYTVLMFIRQTTIYENEVEIELNIKGYSKEEKIEENKTIYQKQSIKIDGEYEYKTVGITLAKECDKIEIELRTNGIVGLIISEPILINQKSGIKYEYDEEDNITIAKNGSYLKEIYYEGNRIKEQIDGRKKEYFYDYDELGNAKLSINSYGINSNYEYNEESELTKESHEKEDKKIETKYEYENGNIIKISDNVRAEKYSYENGEVKEEYNYQETGELKSKQVTTGNQKNNIEYSYKNKDIESIITPNKGKYDFEYTTKRQISKITKDEMIYIK